MSICPVYETLRTPHCGHWKPLEAPGLSDIYLSLSFTNDLSTYLILFLPLPSSDLPSAAMSLMDFSALVGDLSKMWFFNSMTFRFPMTLSSALFSLLL